MSFLPDNYEKPAGKGNYYKLQTGDNRFRILSPAITGWIDWDNKQPVRTKDRPEISIDPTKPAKHFWAFVIWDYKEKAIKIMEITQSTIQDAIFSLHSESEWGNPQSYDLNIKKTGEKMETKYNVVPTPPKPLSAEIKELYSMVKINLNELYSGGDPFNSEKSSTPEAYLPEERTTEITGEDMRNIADIPF